MSYCSSIKELHILLPIFGSRGLVLIFRLEDQTLSKSQWNFETVQYHSFTTGSFTNVKIFVVLIKTHVIFTISARQSVSQLAVLNPYSRRLETVNLWHVKSLS